MKIKKYSYLTAIITVITFTLFTSCKGKEPANPDPVDEMTWQAPVETDYEFSMTYVTQIAFAEGTSKNEQTAIGAFMGEECRGLTTLKKETDNLYLCFLTIYSNQVSGESIEIKVFDADKKKIHNNCKVITFSSGSRQGSDSEVLRVP